MLYKKDRIALISMCIVHAYSSYFTMVQLPLAFCGSPPGSPLSKGGFGVSVAGIGNTEGGFGKRSRGVVAQGQRAFCAPSIRFFFLWKNPSTLQQPPAFLCYSLKIVAEGFDCSTLQTFQRDLAETVWGVGNFLQKMVNPLWHVET